MQIEEATSREAALDLLVSLQGYDAWKERVEFLAEPGALERFLALVVERVPYYRAHFAARGTVPAGLGDFPLTTRSDYNADPAGFVADPLPGEGPRAARTTTSSTGSSGSTPGLWTRDSFRPCVPARTGSCW
jgi:hypothetical protein